MKDSERLLARLRKDGQQLPSCTELRRTFRNAASPIGAWSWFAWCPLCLNDREHGAHSNLRVGSHWPMSWLLAAKKLTYTYQEWGDICVDPVIEQTEERS